MEILKLPELHRKFIIENLKKFYAFAYKAFGCDISCLLNTWHSPRFWRYSEKQADVVLPHM